MKTSIKLLVLIIVTASFFSCSKESDGLDSTTATSINTSSVESTGLETEVISLVNTYRESIGLQKVAVLPPAYTEALNHTKYMIQQGKISHDGFDERARNLMTTAKAKVILENVAAGYNTAQDVMNAWLNSESHRKNIEDPNVSYMGLSVQQNTVGNNFYTQIFVGI